MSKYCYDIVQTFRGGHTKVITTRTSRADAEATAEDIADHYAAIYGEAHTKVVRRKVKRVED